MVLNSVSRTIVSSPCGRPIEDTKNMEYYMLRYGMICPPRLCPPRQKERRPSRWQLGKDQQLPV